MKIWYVIIFSCLAAIANGQPQQGALFTAVANSCAARTDLWSVNSNPAGIHDISGFSLSANYTSSYLLRSLATEALALALPVSNYVVGCSIQRYGLSGYREAIGGIAFARELGKLSIGLSWHFFNINIERYMSNYKFSVTTGLQYKLAGQLDLGAYLIVHPELKQYPVFAGISYHPGEHVIISYTLNTSRYEPNNCIGLEYGLGKRFYLRYGISLMPFNQSFGFSAKMARLSLNTAFVLTRGIGVSPQTEIAYVF